LNAVLRDYADYKTRTHSLESFLLPSIGRAYAYEYKNLLIDKIKMVLASTDTNNSIELTDGEIIDLEGLGGEEIDELAREKAEEPLQYGSEGRTLLNEIIARPDINYDFGDRGKNGRFRKINKRVYYVVGDDQPDPRRNNLAYDLTDTPVTLFIAYVIVSYLFDYRLLEDEASAVAAKAHVFSWKDVFCFLLDPRFQEECFRVLDINNVCKIRVLVPWTNLLKLYFESWVKYNVFGFDKIYSESGDKTETYIERDSTCNLLKFLGVDPVEAASLGEKSTSCKGIKEVILSLDRFI